MKEFSKESLSGILDLIKEREKVYFYSDFKFLNAHKGHRPGNLHLYLGVAHGGKSTLIRSLILDALKRVDTDKKILVWLSEETENDFLIEFSMALRGFEKKDAEVIFKKLIVHSELSFSKHFKNEPLRRKFEYFKDAVSREDVDIIFYDNITTSCFYMDQKIDVQSFFIKEVKEIVGDINKPLIFVAHTGAEVTENSHRLINMNDIRGCKSIVNVVQYCYILQRFHIGEFYFPTLRITKHRGQSVENKMYYITFDKEKNLYVQDRHLEFEEMKDNFKRRNVL
jgi:hypothetical protein